MKIIYFGLYQSYISYDWIIWGLSYHMSIVYFSYKWKMRKMAPFCGKWRVWVVRSTVVSCSTLILVSFQILTFMLFVCYSYTICLYIKSNLNLYLLYLTPDKQSKFITWGRNKNLNFCHHFCTTSRFEQNMELRIINKLYQLL